MKKLVKMLSVLLMAVFLGVFSPLLVSASGFSLFTLPGMDDPVRSRVILMISVLVIALIALIVLFILSRRDK